MARLWIILFFVWYHVINIAKTESTTPNDFDNEPINSIENNQMSPQTKIFENNNYENQEVDETKSSNRIKRSIENNQQEMNGDHEGNHIDPTISPNKLNAISNCLHPLIKRKFAAWGGKRGLYYNNQLFDCWTLLKENPEIFTNEIYDDDYKIDDLIDSRNKLSFPDDQPPKRLPFNAWGGKRDMPVEGLGPKRLPFKAWGGKRSSEEYAFPVYQITNGRYAQILKNPYEIPFVQKAVNRKKTKFHSWGGKRSFNDDNISAMQELYDDEENPINDEIKRTFHSWGGKRNADV